MKAQTPQRVAIERIAALVLLNAMIFQEVLAQTHPKVRPLTQVVKGPIRSSHSKSTGTSYFSTSTISRFFTSRTNSYCVCHPTPM